MDKTLTFVAVLTILAAVIFAIVLPIWMICASMSFGTIVIGTLFGIIFSGICIFLVLSSVKWIAKL